MFDLFCGVGSFTYAAQSFPHLLLPLTGLDIDTKIGQTFANTYGLPTMVGDVREFDPLSEPVLLSNLPDLITAGFPCQPFSSAGKRDGLSDRENGDLFEKTVELVALLRPRYVIFENVMGIVNMQDGKISQQMDALLQQAGYETTWICLNSSDWNIPQNRRRIFILCQRKDVAISKCCVMTILKNVYAESRGTPTPKLHTFLGIAPLFEETSHTLRGGGYNTRLGHSRNWAEYEFLDKNAGVYHLSQKDCEKLQGFEDGFIRWDSSMTKTGKLKAVGNTIPTCLTRVIFCILEVILRVYHENEVNTAPYDRCTLCQTIGNHVVTLAQ